MGYSRAFRVDAATDLSNIGLSLNDEASFGRYQFTVSQEYWQEEL